MSSSSTSSPTDQFGPNEWLVEEMYQRFLDDPNSVDPAWHEFFADYRPGDASPTSGQRRADRRRHDGRALAAHADREARPAGEAPRARRRRPRREPSDAGQAAERRALAAPEAGTAAKPAAGSTSQAAAARPSVRPGTPTASPPPLRGAASAVVKNMNASLARAHRHERARGAGEAAGRQPRRHQQPAAPHPRRQDQLHAPDRLRGGPGAGRVPGDEPALRRGGRASPTVVQPEHVNLGLAIDLPGKDKGQRTLVVVSIKGCESLSFAQFWSAYEDIVRKARSGNAHRRGLHGHHDLAHQPRHPRHQPLGAAADAGPGHDRRRRRDGVPRRVPGRERGDASPRSASARSSR